MAFCKPSMKVDSFLFLYLETGKKKLEAKDNKASQSQVLLLHFLEQHLGTISEIKHVLLQRVLAREGASVEGSVVLMRC